jgi:hypothetical protein
MATGRETGQPRSDLPSFYLHLDDILCPEEDATYEESVYGHALMCALVTEGALAAARRIDEKNQEHVEHVAFGISFAFAVAHGIFDSVPMGVASGLPGLIDPFKELFLRKETEKYSAGELAAAINKAADRICAKAKEGQVIPGIPNKKPYQVVGGEQAMMELQVERKGWGEKFISHFETIRKLA